MPHGSVSVPGRVQQRMADAAGPADGGFEAITLEGTAPLTRRSKQAWNAGWLRRSRTWRTAVLV
ncbi:MAG: hypothetical protein NTX53_03830 [candidate division WOR-3 bacterium]|nr:hypothetical protein [candidate division WOR-3 bacterium]